MDTLKVCNCKKEINLMLTARTERSKLLEETLKLPSYPSTKLNKENTVVLSRKLLEEVKTLQKENKDLRSKISHLEQENIFLVEKCRHYQFCQSLIDESQILLSCLEEAKPQISLSQSVIQSYEKDRGSFCSSEKMELYLTSVTEKTNQRLLGSPCTSPKCSYLSTNVKEVEQQVQKMRTKYSQKINELLKINANLMGMFQTYKFKYTKLKEDVGIKSRNIKHIAHS